MSTVDDERYVLWTNLKNQYGGVLDTGLSKVPIEIESSTKSLNDVTIALLFVPTDKTPI